MNEVRTIEFDINFAAGATGPENLIFILDDVGQSAEPTVDTFIPNWNGMTDEERYQHWLHVSVDLQSLHSVSARFNRFLLFNNGDSSLISM